MLFNLSDAPDSDSIIHTIDMTQTSHCLQILCTDDTSKTVDSKVHQFM